MAVRGPFLFVCASVLVLVQCTTMIATLFTTLNPLCASNGDCPWGRYCDHIFTNAQLYGTEPESFTGRCFSCHQWTNVTRTIDFCKSMRPADESWEDYKTDGKIDNAAYAAVEARNFQNISNMEFCARCVNPFTGTPMSVQQGTAWPNLAGPSRRTGVIVANIAKMGAFEFVAVFFFSVIVGLTIVAELNDIEVVSIIVARAGDKLSRGWRWAFKVLNGFRRWVFLPSTLMVVIGLMYFNPATTLSLCVNTLFVLCVCGLNRILHTLGLSPTIRAQAQGASLFLTEAEEAAQWRIKVVHVCLIVLFILLALVTAGEVTMFIWPVLTLCCGGMLERGHKDVKETAIRIAKVCGATIVGYALVILLMYVEGESLFGDKIE